MLIRLKQNTTVPLDHPYRVPLPHWGYVAEDVFDESMVVEVPDEELPPALLDGDELKFIDTYRGPVAYYISDAQLAAWHAYLDEHYQEHHGEFRPQVA